MKTSAGQAKFSITSNARNAKLDLEKTQPNCARRNAQQATEKTRQKFAKQSVPQALRRTQANYASRLAQLAME